MTSMQGLKNNIKSAQENKSKMASLTTNLEVESSPSKKSKLQAELAKTKEEERKLLVEWRLRGSKHRCNLAGGNLKDCTSTSGWFGL